MCCLNERHDLYELKRTSCVAGPFTVRCVNPEQGLLSKLCVAGMSVMLSVDWSMN